MCLASADLKKCAEHARPYSDFSSAFRHACICVHMYTHVYTHVYMNM